MAKTMTRKATRKAIGRHREIALPFYFKQISDFLREADVPAAQRPDLIKARRAMGVIRRMIYGVEAGQICIGEAPLFPPMF